MGKLVVTIINYNGTETLERCVQSLFEQKHEDFELVFIDNSSPDKGGLDYMHREFDQNPKVSIVANTVNKGYAKAANQGIRMAISKEAEYVCISNTDIVFTPEYFSKLIARINKDEKIAAITGKIYKYDYKNDKPTDIIDSVGLFAFRNRRVIDNGQGLIDAGQFDKEKEVFGVSGACPLYRIKALEDVKVMDEYFDEDFFMYKEDVDLSWRFNLYGWKCFYYPEAVAYHGRGTGVYKRFFTTDVIKNRRGLSPFQKKLSFKNQLFMELKNDLPKNRLKAFLPLTIRKIAAPFYITFVEPYLWVSYYQFLKLVPRMLKKRKIIMQNKKVSDLQMNEWFKKQSEYIQ